MKKEKVVVVINYDKLSNKLKQDIEIAYPNGFAKYWKDYVFANGKKAKVLAFETNGIVYQIKMTIEEAKQLSESMIDSESTPYNFPKIRHGKLNHKKGKFNKTIVR